MPRFFIGFNAFCDEIYTYPKGSTRNSEKMDYREDLTMDFEEIIKKYASDAGDIPAQQVSAMVTALKNAVGNSFVEKSRYNARLDEIEVYKEKERQAGESAASAEKWKTKYDALKDDFTAYKSEQSKKETRASKEKAYRSLLQKAGISERRIDTVVKVSDIDSLELDENGEAKYADKLTADIKSEWADLIVTASVTGADAPTPPESTHIGSGTLTKDEIFKIKDASERQNAIKENIQLFKKEI